MMTPLQMQAVMHTLQRVEQARHCEKQPLWQACADQLKVSKQTVYRWRRELVGRSRKKRGDAGKLSLRFEEAQLIAMYFKEATRANAKRLPSLEMAVETLRADGKIMAGRVDEETGELRLLSLSAISRALHAYRLHPDQLAAPEPAAHLKTAYPNQLWQIDPSLCVLYYLPTDNGLGLQVMDEKVFYKNKPANIRKIEKERVWRYVVTDHASGLIYVHYVLGAESGKNLVDAFIGASQPKGHGDPFQGIPEMVMVDPGSANTGAVFRNLCRHLDVRLQVNVPGHPRAKGQVEKANDMVERSFEHRLALLNKPLTSLEQINEQAWAWMRWFNGTRLHSRHGMTRYEAWQRINEDQLVLAPSADVMRAISVSAMETRKVDQHLEIRFNSRTYSVKDVPEVFVGDTVMVASNAWQEDACIVLREDDKGNEQRFTLLPEQKTDFGFFETAAQIGEEYKSTGDTILERNRKSLELLAMSADTLEEAAAKRKHKTPIMNGEINPMANIEQSDLPSYLPSRGTEHSLNLPQIESATLPLFDAAKKLADVLGDVWSPHHYDWLSQRYPEGVKEDALGGIADQLRSGATALRAVKGGEA